MRIAPLLLALVGCSSFDATLADSARAAHERMHERFDAARRMQLAIARSDLDAAKIEAATIESLDEPDFLPQWRPYVDSIRASAHQVQLANDTVAAARLSAELGRRCAQCHAASSSRIVLPREDPPRDRGKHGPQMASHQWAAARMWDGLIAPDEERWLQGARMLATARIDFIAEGGPHSVGLTDHASRMKSLASRAQVTASQHDRAALYGDLLATCARCHFAIRDR
jgi:hypothetical protein